MYRMDHLKPSGLLRSLLMYHNHMWGQEHHVKLHIVWSITDGWDKIQVQSQGRHDESHSEVVTQHEYCERYSKKCMSRIHIQ